MLFNSWVFVAFFAIVLPLYYCLSWRWQNRFLVLASYFFYSMWDWRFSFLLMISTVVDFFVGSRLGRTEDPKQRRMLLGISLVVNLGILGFFKYFNFFVSSAVDFVGLFGFEANLTLFSLVLPVGISFYTFQTLAYTIDIYRGQQKPTRDFVAFALYVSYFPQLVAGPIERAKRLLPQLERPRTVDAAAIASGVQLIFWGYVKKIAIADSLAIYVDKIFSGDVPSETPLLWLGMYAFTIQLYCDFSGYTDIARGVSRLLGIDLMVNFKQPLLSPNITESWRRWHVSLSTWMRDYIYIPLGGNRKGARRTYLNLILTMLVGGLWHGANWTFIVWGAFNGILLSIHRLVSANRNIALVDKPKSLRTTLSYGLRVLITFHLFALGFVIFRAPDLAFARSYIVNMFRELPAGFSQLSAGEFAGFLPSLVFYGILIAGLDTVCWWRDRDIPVAAETPWWLGGSAFALGALVLLFVRESTGAPFIYFQF